MVSREIPVTIVSGSLGAGKTTLLNHLLENADRRIAVLVNDVGEVNVDASLLEGAGDLSRDGIAELSNGCICCELQDDLETEVRRLASRHDFDHLVVEASGISEPAPIARIFTTGSAAAARYGVDALVTVVDSTLLSETFTGETVERRTPPDAEDRPLSDLLVEQIEVSNVVLLNKVDLVDDTELDRLEALVRALQPDADIVRTSYGRIDPDRLLGRGAFDPAELGELAGWQQALQEARAHERGGDENQEGDGSDDHRRDRHESDRHHQEHEREHHHREHDHRSPETVYGIESLTYRQRRPFHPDRFAAFLRGLPAEVVRSKGICWVAGRDDLILQLSQAGSSAALSVEGRWVASLPETQRDLYRRNHPDEPWDDEHGDRRTELVFIGTDLDGVETDLDDCLLEIGAAVDDAPAFPVEGDETVVLRE